MFSLSVETKILLNNIITTKENHWLYIKAIKYTYIKGINHQGIIKIFLGLQRVQMVDQSRATLEKEDLSVHLVKPIFNL